MKRLTGILLIIGLLALLGASAEGLQVDRSTSATQATGRQVEAGAPQTPVPPAPPASNSDKPMTPEEADAAIDRLRQTVHDSMMNGAGPMRQMDPETQRQIAESADKFMSDPAIRGALARQIRDFRMPWQSSVFWLSGILVPIAFFALIALFFWMVFRSKRAKLQSQIAAQAQLISKFGSGAELAAFLATPAGMQMLHGMSSPQVNVKNRVVRHQSIGAVFGTVGLGSLLFSHAVHGFFTVGVVFLFLGLGFLISAWLTSRLESQGGSNVSTPPALPPTLPPQQ